jgi:RNA polymerase sigma factor (sigma-70 family)
VVCNGRRAFRHIDIVQPDAAPLDPLDRRLINAFLGGDEDAFRALYERHTPRLRVIVVRLLGRNGADADDVVQETWLAACRGLRGFRGTARFSTWLTTIGIRSVRDRLRSGVDLDTLPVFAEIEAPPAPGAATVIDLERAIARLPAQYRLVLVLHDVEGFTHAEIGHQLGMAEGSSKAALSRARAAVRAMLSTEGSYVGER